MRRHVATVSVVVMLVLAGCGGAGTQTTSPTAETTASPTTDAVTTDAATTTDGATTTTTDGESVEVVGGNLSVDQTEVFTRVQRLMGTDVRAQSVEIRNLTEHKGYQPGQAPLFQYLGVGNLSLDPNEPGGLTTPSGKVYVYPGNGSSAEVEQVLVHEFVHMTQYRASMLPWLSAIDQPRLTHDLLQTRLALIEGGAVYVTDAYAEKHLDGVDPSDRFAQKYENGSASAKYFYARYHHGHQYVDSQIDSPKDLASVYENGPNTTEQILHGYAPSEEPPAELTVSVNSTGEWSEGENDTMGELFTRVVLQTELDAETAQNAATGWGSDTLYQFTTGSEDPGFAWTLRMDDASEADEFETAATDFAEGRRASSDADFRVVRVDDETVVVLFGNPDFVANASVTGSNANVTVTVT